MYVIVVVFIVLLVLNFFVVVYELAVEIETFSKFVQFKSLSVLFTDIIY
jgi:hypothetical protein